MSHILCSTLFSCKNYGSSGDPKYYLVYDVNVECWKHEHLVWSLSIGIPTLIIGLLAPLGILAFWTRDKDLRAVVKVQKACTFIFKPYRNNALFWFSIFSLSSPLTFSSKGNCHSDP